jgi:HEAT repeat protein
MPVPTDDLVWMLAAAAAAYFCAAALVVVGRLRDDRRRRLLERLEAAGGEARPRVDSAAALESIVATTRTTVLLRLAAEGAGSRAVQEAIAQAIVLRLGTGRLRRLADGSARAGSWRRIAALRILALARCEEAWASLARSLEEGSPEVRAAAVTLLGQLADRRAAELLVRALERGRAPRSRIATALERFPLDVGDLLVPLLEARDGAVRYWAAHLVRRYPDACGVAAVCRLARDPHPLVRRAAIETLGALRRREALPVLVACLLDEMPFVRAHAARALALQGEADAAELLLPLLADRDWWVRAAAKESLQQLGPAVVPIVARALACPDAFARDGALEVLQALGGTAGVGAPTAEHSHA